MSLSTIRIAWRNLGRSRRRTLLAIGAIALGQLTLVFVNGIMAGNFNKMLDTITGPLMGHVQVHHAEWREERAIDLFVGNFAQVKTELESLDEVTSVSPRIYAPVLAAYGERSDQPATAEPAVVVGLDCEAEVGDNGVLGNLDTALLPGEGSVAVGKVLATRLKLKEGDQLAIIGQDADGFPVSDLFEVKAIINSSIDLVKTMGVVMPIDDAGTFLAMPDEVHEVIIRGKDHNNAGALAATIATLPALSGMEVISWRESMPMIARLIDLKIWFDMVLLAFVFVAAAAGIANTSMMSTFERIHELGMLLAMGTRPARIVGMILIESVALGLIGVAIGSVLGWALVTLTAYTGIDYAALGGVEAEDIAFEGVSFSFILYPAFQLRHVILGVIAVTITSVLASTWPAMLAARLEPVEAMRS